MDAIQVVDLVVIILLILYYGPTIVLMISRHEHRGLKERSIVLLVTSSLGGFTCILVNFLLRDYIGWKEYNCGLLFWSMICFIPLYGFPFIVNSFYLYSKYQLAKIRIQRKESQPGMELLKGEGGNRNSGSDGSMSVKDRTLFMQKLKWRVSLVGIVVLLLAILAPILVVGLIIWYGEGDTYAFSNVGCRISTKVLMVYFGLAFVYLLIAVASLYMLKKVDDAFGIKRDIQHAYMIQLCFLIVYGILAFPPRIVELLKDASGEYIFHPNWIILLATVVTHTVTIVRPLYLSYEAQRDSMRPFTNIDNPIASPTLSPSSSELLTVDTLSLTVVLSSPEGIQSFSDHLCREFSTENIDFWKECLRFQQSSGKEQIDSRASVLMAEYVKEGSTNWVNLPSACRIELEKNYAEGSIDIHSFDKALREIEFLMEKDPFRRYKKGPLCAKFVDSVNNKGGSGGVVVVELPETKGKKGRGSH